MEVFLQYILQGIPVGCVYALLAVGLVLTYRTTGVFNLAYGAQSFAAAAIFYQLHIRNEWPLWLAFVVTVGIIGPLFGAVLDLALFRHLRGATWAARLVASLGLFVAIPEMVLAWFGRSPAYRPPSIAPLVGIADGRVFRPSWGEVQLYLNATEVATIGITVVVVVGLGLLMQFTVVGLRMRAVVESPRLSELAGVDADRVGLTSWMLSSVLASLAGVLLAPLFAQVNPAFFIMLLVSAIAAAAFGRLSSIWMTFAGALILGILQQVLAGELPAGSALARGIRPSLPFIFLFLLLVCIPALRRGRDAGDPLAGVDPPTFAPAASYKDAALERLTKIIFPVFIASFIALNLFFLSGLWVRRFTDGLAFAVIFLSITVFTGLAGQISLAQATFAGIGAFATGQLVTNMDLPIFVAVLIAAGAAAAVGALLAIPAVRLAGIFLTLATLAFALFAENVIFPLDWMSGGDSGIRVPRPSGLESDQAFFLLVFATFGLLAMVVILVRNGTTGRFLGALRSSEVAAAAIGINARRQRILLFALAAAIAAVGGALRGMLNLGTGGPVEWSAWYGAAWVVIVVTIGVRTVDGAAIAGVSFILVQWLLRDAWNMPGGFAMILFGLGAITYARHPEGVAEWRTRTSIENIVANRRSAARHRELVADGIAVRGYRRAVIDVGLTVVTLGVWTFAFVGGAYATTKRLIGDRFSTAAGVALNLLVIPSFFLVPRRIQRAFESRGKDSPVTWKIGIGPTVLTCVVGYVFYRYYTLPLRDVPTDLGLGLAVFFVTVVILQWVGQVRGALNALAIDLAESEAAPDAPADATTVAMA